MAGESPEAKARWLEFVAPVLMGVTTLASAWCSFQSSRWSGHGNDLAGQADKLQRTAAALHVESQQIESAQLHIALQAIEARLQGNDKVLRFYLDRMPAELKPAWDKWLALQPFENPSAPPHPFVPELYTPRFEEEIHRLSGEAAQAMAQANTGAAHAGSYLRLTILWAMVLFFAGMAGTFRQQRVRRSALACAVALWAYAFVRLIMIPVI